MIRLGVEMGGTFTNRVLVYDADGLIKLGKVPSTPASPDEAVLAGLDRVSESFAVDRGAAGHRRAAEEHGATI